jgi:hypothetical protein
MPRGIFSRFKVNALTSNPYFETARSWHAARSMLTFRPIKPAYTAGCRLQAIRIHVRDHKQRVLSVGDRTLEAHYGKFVLSQARKPVDEAQRLALKVSYGRDPRDAAIAGRTARIYELGPEPEFDDIDGRAPAVVTWSDGELFFLLASDTARSDVLVKIALSLYDGAGKVRRFSGRARE